MSERWLPVVGFEGLYEVSDHGRVRNSRGKVLRPCKINGGYDMFILTKDKIRKALKGHRLVAIAFIANPQNKPDVNHKDGVKAHNHYSNLEWVTRAENNLHAYRVLGKLNAQLGKVGKLAHDARTYYFLSPGGEVVHVVGLTEFCRENDLQQSSMSLVNSGKRGHHKGWKKYIPPARTRALDLG